MFVSENPRDPSIQTEEGLCQKLVSRLPAFPRKRYNIFAGTNTAAEWRTAALEWLSGGPYDRLDVIEEYEREFARCCGAEHGISFGAGRMALYAILEAYGIGAGDEVIIPAFTCVVVPNAIIYRGARPIYVDIEPHHFNIDVTKVESAITPRTKALYAQHTFGQPCDVDSLKEIAKRHGLPVIEDAAHALGATYKGRPAGSLTEVSFFSTDHSKVINTHLGGMVVTSDRALATRIRDIQTRAPFLDKRQVQGQLRTFLAEFAYFSPGVLWLGRTIHALLGRTGSLFYFMDELKTGRPDGYPCRLSSSHARLGLSQLRSLRDNLSHRRLIARWLENKVAWHGGDMEESAWLRYSFMVGNRGRFESAFGRRFDLGIWFTSVVSGRTRDLSAVGYQLGMCPVAEFVTRHIVNIPTHLGIPLEAVQEEVDRSWNHFGPDILAPSAASAAVPGPRS